MQKLSAAIASVLLHNQGLYAPADATAELSASSSSSHASNTSQTEPSQLRSETTLRYSKHDSHAERDLPDTTISRDSAALQGVVSSPEAAHPVSTVYHSPSSAFACVAQDGQIAANSASADPEAEVGCNDFVSFFVAELLGGSAEK